MKTPITGELRLLEQDPLAPTVKWSFTEHSTVSFTLRFHGMGPENRKFPTRRK